MWCDPTYETWNPWLSRCDEKSWGAWEVFRARKEVIPAFAHRSKNTHSPHPLKVWFLTHLEFLGPCDSLDGGLLTELWEPHQAWRQQQGSGGLWWWLCFGARLVSAVGASSGGVCWGLGSGGWVRQVR